MKVIKISSQFNNCAFHVLSPYIAVFLATSTVEDPYTFKEVTPSWLNKKRFERTMGYKYLLEAFASFYGLPFDRKIGTHLSTLLKKFTHPLDVQVLLGPVLRLTLKKVLLNHAAHKEALKPSFVTLVRKCAERYHMASHDIRLNDLDYKIAWLSALRWDSREEYEELFFPNISIIAELMDAPANRIDEQWDVAYKNMCEYMGDIKKGIFVSQSQLELLCESFRFHFTYNAGNEAPNNASHYLARVCAFNESNLHWELVARNEDTQWDFTQGSSMPVFKKYHDNSLRPLPEKLISSSIGAMQGVFASKIKKVLLNGEVFSEKIFTISPNQAWLQNSGLESLVELICQAVTEEKPLPPIAVLGGQLSFDKTEGFKQFLVEFAHYYDLPHEISSTQSQACLKELLLNYRLTTERFLLLSPILRQMGGPQEERNLYLNELADLYKKFNLPLEVYYANTPIVSEFDKVFNNVFLDKFPPVRLVFSPQGWYPLERKSINAEIQPYIRHYSPCSAFIKRPTKKAQAIHLKGMISAYFKNPILPLEGSLWDLSVSDATLVNLPSLVNKRIFNLVMNGTAVELETTLRRLTRDALAQASKETFPDQVNLSSPAALGRNWTALHFAVYLGKVETVKVLLEMGADWRVEAYWEIADKSQLREKRASWQVSALELAACLDQRQIVTLILRYAKPADNKWVQKAYNAACNFSKIKPLYAFLGYKDIKHSSTAVLNAIEEKDLFLMQTLLQSGAPLPFKNTKEILEFTFNKTGSSENKRKFSHALQNLLLLALHQNLLKHKKLTQANLVFDQETLRIIKSALQAMGPRWTFDLIQYFNQWFILLGKEEELQAFIQQNHQLLLELVAEQLCVLIRDNRSEQLSEYLMCHPFALIIPGKGNPMHFAFHQGKWTMLEEAWIKNLRKISQSTPYRELMPTQREQLNAKAAEQLKFLSDRAYDQFDRSLTFRLEKMQTKTQLDSQLAAASNVFNMAFLYSQKLYQEARGGIDAVVDRLHEKNKHTTAIKNKAVYKYGTPTLFALKTVGTIATGGVIKYSLDLARYLLPNIIKMPIYYTVRLASKQVAPYIGFTPQTGEVYTPMLIENILSIAMMPSYYLYSTLLETGTYLLFKNRGFDTTEAATYLLADGLAHNLATAREDLPPIDERYQYHLHKNLEPFLGTEWTAKVSPVIGQIDAYTRYINQSIHAVSDTVYQKVTSFSLGSDLVSLSSISKQLTDFVQPMTTAYHRFLLRQEHLFHLFEFEILQLLTGSNFKKDRLLALQNHLTNYQRLLGNEIELELNKCREEAKEAKSKYEETKNEEDRKLYENKTQQIETLTQSLDKQNQIIQQCQESENKLFKDTQGYAYFEEWQEKYSALKFEEFSQPPSSKKIKASQEAERAAWEKMTFYCNEQVSHYAGSWSEYLTNIFNKHKDNFVDTSNVQTLVDRIVNITFGHSDRYQRAAACADEIIKIKYPLYPDVGDPVAIEAERKGYKETIFTYKLDAHKDKHKRNDVEGYLKAIFTGQPEQKRISHSKEIKTWLAKGAVNVISLAFSGGKFLPFPEFFGGPGHHSSAGNNYIGAQFSYNFGGPKTGMQADVVANNVRVVGLYNPSKQFTFALFPDTKVGSLIPNMNHAFLPSSGVLPRLTMPQTAFPSLAAGISSESVPQITFSSELSSASTVPQMDPRVVEIEEGSLYQGSAKKPAVKKPTKKASIIQPIPLAANGKTDSPTPLSYGKIAKPSIAQPPKENMLAVKPPLLDKSNKHSVFSPAFDTSRRVTRSMAKAETGKVASQSTVGVQAVSVATVSKVPFFEMARSLGISPQTENLLVEKYQIPTESLQGSLLWGGYFLRALNGDRSPEIIGWQKSNKARPKISLFRTEQMPEENAVLGPLMRGMLEAAGDLLALGVKGATFPHRELIRFICGEETITEEISKKVANFIELEAGRIHMGQTPETLQKGKDFINYVGEGKFVLALEQKAHEFELLPREEKLQIIGSELFNWVLLPGAAGKVSTSAARIVVAAEKGGIKAASGVAQGGSAAATGVSAFSETAITRQVAQLEEVNASLPAVVKGKDIPQNVAFTPRYNLRSKGRVESQLKDKSASLSSGHGILGDVGDEAAKNHINKLRLQHQLKMEQASSIFTKEGFLTEEAIMKSRPLRMKGLYNEDLKAELLSRGGKLSDWKKYTTQPIPSPAGSFEMHFYKNKVTGEIYYGMDYKAVLHHQGKWDLPPESNFAKESPKFKLK